MTIFLDITLYYQLIKSSHILTVTPPLNFDNWSKRGSLKVGGKYFFLSPLISLPFSVLTEIKIKQKRMRKKMGEMGLMDFQTLIRKKMQHRGSLGFFVVEMQWILKEHIQGSKNVKKIRLGLHILVSHQLPNPMKDLQSPIAPSKVPCNIIYNKRYAHETCK